MLEVRDGQGNEVPAPYRVTLEDNQPKPYLLLDNPDYWQQPQPAGLGVERFKSAYIQLARGYNGELGATNLRIRWDEDRLSFYGNPVSDTYIIAAIYGNYPSFREPTKLLWQNPEWLG